jgi:small multidrug resistance family-3 protein
MMGSIVLFLLAGVAEIGGGYLIWLWLKESKPVGYGVIGGIILILYGVIPTFQSYPSFGRVYAAYGRVFIFSLCCGAGWSTKRHPICTTGWVLPFV